MPYAARIERHSISPEGIVLMTAVVTYPRVVIAEVKTHRRLSAQSEVEFFIPDRTSTLTLSKSSASSRAIPIARMIDMVVNDPYVPEKFSRGGKGMQEAGWLEGQEHDLAVRAWLAARDNAVASAKLMIELNVHKQDCNRLLEPWSWVTQIITGDQFGWSNFFALRTDAAAMPAFRKIARKLYLLYRKSVPERLDYQQWHVPFLDLEEVKCLRAAEQAGDGPCVQQWTYRAAARCARVSYLNHEGRKTTMDEDIAFFNRLLGHMPRHCYDDKTEVLTDAGWKLWPDVFGSEKFMTISKDNRIEYQPASERIAYQYSGDMVAINTIHVDAMVTPGHKMLAIPRTHLDSVDWKLIPASDFCQRSHRIPMGGGIWGASEYNLDIAKLIGFFVGDGSYAKDRSVDFNLRKPRKIKFLRDVTSSAGFRLSENNGRFRVIAGGEFYKQIAACYHDREKYIPDFIRQSGLETIRAVLSGLVEADGTVSDTGKTTISTTSTFIRDQIQELAVKCNMAASVRLSRAAGISYWGGPSKAVYRCCIFRGVRNMPRIGWTTELREKEVKRVAYSGMVYCVSVPNRTLYVRRNGKAMWCGNCAPAEHVATPLSKKAITLDPTVFGNFTGWMQLRKTINHEYITNFVATDDQVATWEDEVNQW